MYVLFLTHSQAPLATVLSCHYLAKASATGIRTRKQVSLWVVSPAADAWVKGVSGWSASRATLCDSAAWRCKRSPTEVCNAHMIAEQQACLLSSHIFFLALRMVASFYSDGVPFQSEYTAQMHTNDGKRSVNSVWGTFSLMCSILRQGTKTLFLQPQTSGAETRSDCPSPAQWEV